MRIKAHSTRAGFWAILAATLALSVQLRSQQPLEHASHQANEAEEQNPLNLPSIHPDEPAEYTFNKRLSLQTATSAVANIDAALSSFRVLTEKYRKANGLHKTAEVPFTSADLQTLGFPNWVALVKGTILKQDYQIKKLELELAQERYEHGEIKKAILDEKSAECEKSSVVLKAFWSSMKIAD